MGIENDPEGYHIIFQDNQYTVPQTSIIISDKWKFLSSVTYSKNHIIWPSEKWIQQINIIMVIQSYCMAGLIHFFALLGLTTRLSILYEPLECWEWGRLSYGRPLKSWIFIMSNPCSYITCLRVVSTGVINYGSMELGFIQRHTFRSGKKRLLGNFWFHLFELICCLQYVNMDGWFSASHWSKYVGI